MRGGDGSNMLFVTGDTHGEEARFRNSESVLETLTEEDKLFIGGDFGYLGSGYKEKSFLRYLKNKPYQILFVDGNHEKFELLENYPVSEWNGGKVHIICKDARGRPKIIHLMRGQVFEIEGKKIFTFGGGYSLDRYRRTPQ